MLHPLCKMLLLIAVSSDCCSCAGSGFGSRRGGGATCRTLEIDRISRTHGAPALPRRPIARVSRRETMFVVPSPWGRPESVPNSSPSAPPYRERRQQGIPARLPPPGYFSRGQFTTSTASTRHDCGEPVGGGPQQLCADLPTTSASPGRLPPAQGEALAGYPQVSAGLRSPSRALHGGRQQRSCGALGEVPGNATFPAVPLAFCWVTSGVRGWRCVLVAVKPFIVETKGDTPFAVYL